MNGLSRGKIDWIERTRLESIIAYELMDISIRLSDTHDSLTYITYGSYV